MRRICAFVLSSLSLASPATGGVAAPEPVLLSASQRDGHVLANYSLGALVPGEVVVATSTRRSGVGALTIGVKLREKLTLTTTAGMLRWRSRRALAPGAYYVQVSGIDVGGVTDCAPRQAGCGQEWSNVRRVVVRPR